MTTLASKPRAELLADIDPAKACREASGSLVYLVLDGVEVVKTTN